MNELKEGVPATEKAVEDATYGSEDDGEGKGEDW